MLDFFSFYWSLLHGMWDLSSLTRDGNCNPCIGSLESLDQQGSFRFFFFFFKTVFWAVSFCLLSYIFAPYLFNACTFLDKYFWLNNVFHLQLVLKKNVHFFNNIFLHLKKNVCFLVLLFCFLNKLDTLE